MNWKFKKMFSVKNYKPRRNPFPHYSTTETLTIRPIVLMLICLAI